jgi:hypothetical protein
MNLYVYSHEEMKSVLSSALEYLRFLDIEFSLEEGFCKTVDVSYPWYNVTFKSYFTDFFITIPSAGLWNRKIYELLHNGMYPLVNPIDADYFLVPAAIIYGNPHSKKRQVDFDNSVLSAFCYHLPYWQYNKDRHVFFIAGDAYEGPNFLSDSFIFRPSCHKDSNDYPLYFDVIIDTSYVRPIDRCDNICAFVGCLETHVLRRNLPFAMDKIPGNKVFESTPNFFSLLSKDSQIKMQDKWIETLNSSKFIMSPRGCGLNSIRFFEAMAFGRVPVLIADDTKLPLEDFIDYSEFIVRVPEERIEDTYVFIEDFLCNHDIIKASELARQTWKDNFSGGKLRKYLEKVLPPVITKRYKI